MKILVLVPGYSIPNVKISQVFIHVRNLFYKKQGIDVSVLNLSAKQDYIIDDIPVFSIKTYKDKLIKHKFDILVCHAPNIRKHYLFLRIYGKKFPKIVFVFHGHEILNLNKVYPKPYSWSNISFLRKKIQLIYDYFKLKLWHCYLPNIIYKSHLIFVSQYLYNEFIKWTKIPPHIIKNNYSIIPNSVGQPFEEENYNLDSEKKYDFITIRNNLDASTYCIDIVNQIAKNNPQFKFLLIGKGEFFKHEKKAENLEWLDTTLNHKEIVEYINLSRCALMPTRQDTHGLMACEMATFGIPLITSNIPVCNEVYSSFYNVRFIENDIEPVAFEKIFLDLNGTHIYEKNTTFFVKNTTMKEVELFNNFRPFDLTKK
jgi:hypothetical protein